MRGPLFSRRWLFARRPSSAQEGEQGLPPARLAPRQELVNVVEFEEMARIKLPASVYSTIAGGDRQPFDRMTFRTRRMVNSMNLDLTTELLGETMFAPLLVGPISQQAQFHPQGELATVSGAAAAKTTVVVSSRSSYPIDQIAAQAKATLWYQVHLEDEIESVRDQTRQAAEAGCKALCITLATPSQPASAQRAAPDWSAIDRIRQDVNLPVLLKGVMNPEDADTAIQRGVQGIVVSDYGGLLATRTVAPIEALSSIVDAVATRIPVLIDGSFRRGSDVLKALALGARAVLLGRPPMWGLSAYGADGVQTVLELLQSELGRSMAGSGRPNIQAISRDLVRIHTR